MEGKTSPQEATSSESKDGNGEGDDKKLAAESPDSGAWFDFSTALQSFNIIPDDVSDKVLDYILPEWTRLLPTYLRKLQRELSMAPGSLADDIWREAHDAEVNPEIRYSATVRVSNELCDEEKEFLARRRRIAAVALAKYLGLKEEDVYEDDVPTIAMCGSGGGLRALVAGAGSMLATEEDGLFDCVTYTSGVSGSCWLQALYHSSFANGSLSRVLEHLKARLDIHIAYPPVAFSSLASAPTNKYLLSGLVEKLRGDPNATFGLVDIYGILLAARLLVPRGELGVDARDFKLSNQRQGIKYGQTPMPIYTAVRHEIPDVEAVTGSTSGNATEAVKEAAAREAWFQWFERKCFLLSPYYPLEDVIGVRETQQSSDVNQSPLMSSSAKNSQPVSPHGLSAAGSKTVATFRPRMVFTSPRCACPSCWASSAAPSARPCPTITARPGRSSKASPASRPLTR